MIVEYPHSLILITKAPLLGITILTLVGDVR